jgi:cytochrome c nitrite reductase small subunit
MSYRKYSAILIGLLFSVPAFAQDNPFQHDPIEHYTSRVLAVIIVVGIALVGYSILRFRGRTEGPLSWALIIGSVGLLPAATGAVGTVLVFERAEKVEFCASCHLTMKEYVDDLKDPDSSSLAALHYQNKYIPSNQCYQCHTSYGMHGTVEAKMAGMVDVYKYFTRTFKKPLHMRTPYKNDDCLKCHSESAKWKPIHEDFKDAVFSGETKCLDCHGDEHPAHILMQRTASK